MFRKAGLKWIFSKVLYRIYPFKIRNYGRYSSLLKGKTGIEIGGPSGMFEGRGFLPVYPIVAGLDICNIRKTDKRVNIICDAVNLGSISSKKYDFVLVSHAIEHLANPIKALKEWLRILKDDGVVVFILPHKDWTWEHDLPAASLRHLLNDYENGTKESDLTHMEEAIKLTDLKLDPFCEGPGSLETALKKLYDEKLFHHHAFNVPLVVEIFNYLNLQILSLDLILPFHMIVLGRKSPAGKAANNKIPSNEAFNWR